MVTQLLLPMLLLHHCRFCRTPRLLIFHQPRTKFKPAQLCIMLARVAAYAQLLEVTPGDCALSAAHTAIPTRCSSAC